MVYPRHMTTQEHTRRAAVPRMSSYLLLSLLFCSMLHADGPQKAPLTRYTGLWTNSPFTSKPPPPEAAPTVNPFDDYTLSGIAPVPGGYRITLVNKTNPEEKRVIEPGIKNEFTVVSVDRNPDKALGTTVVLSSGTLQGTVTFEPELLTLNSPPPPPPPANLPPGVIPSEGNQQQTQPEQNLQREPQRQPRPRIVPPPIPTQGQPQQQGGARVQAQDGRGERRGDRRR